MRREYSPDSWSVSAVSRLFQRVCPQGLPFAEKRLKNPCHTCRLHLESCITSRRGMSFEICSGRHNATIKEKSIKCSKEESQERLPNLRRTSVFSHPLQPEEECDTGTNVGCSSQNWYGCTTKESKRECDEHVELTEAVQLQLRSHNRLSEEDQEEETLCSVESIKFSEDDATSSSKRSIFAAVSGDVTSGVEDSGRSPPQKTIDGEDGPHEQESCTCPKMTNSGQLTCSQPFKRQGSVFLEDQKPIKGRNGLVVPKRQTSVVKEDVDEITGATDQSSDFFDDISHSRQHFTNLSSKGFMDSDTGQDDSEDIPDCAALRQIKTVHSCLRPFVQNKTFVVRNQIFFDAVCLILKSVFWIGDVDISSLIQYHSKSDPVEFDVSYSDALRFAFKTKPKQEYYVHQPNAPEEEFKLDYFSRSRYAIFQRLIYPSPDEISARFIDCDYLVQILPMATQWISLRFLRREIRDENERVCQPQQEAASQAPPEKSVHVHINQGNQSLTAKTIVQDQSKYTENSDGGTTYINSDSHP